MARTPSTTKPKTPAAAKKPKQAVQKQAPKVNPDATKTADSTALPPDDSQRLGTEPSLEIPGVAAAHPDHGAEGEQIEIVYVKSVPVTLRRCGFRFTQEGMGIALSCLTPEQLEILEADPDLVVQRGSVDAIGDEV